MEGNDSFVQPNTSKEMGPCKHKKKWARELRPLTDEQVQYNPSKRAAHDVFSTNSIQKQKKWLMDAAVNIANTSNETLVMAETKPYQPL